MALLASVLLAPALLVTRAEAQATGPVLVAEDFRSATAAPGFVAYGSACLTGAPVGAPNPAGGPLVGCPATRTGPVPPTGAAPDGYLQLTDASADQVGAVLYTEPIPATSGVEITFEQWQYGGNNTFPPADGISFFLVDGTATLDGPGAFGGSLGYAQKLPDNNPANTFLPGVEQGYLGIGLDVLGNYFGDWEQRGDGCAVRSPAGTGPLGFGPGANMVTVRGPGDGTQGYCFLTATTTNLTTTGPWPSTLPGNLQGPLTTLPPDATAAEASLLLEPSKRTVTIIITPAPDPQVSVSVDFNDGLGPQQVLTFAAPLPVPATYSFGFAASTGLFTDVHLIRTVQVQAFVPFPAISLVKAVDVDPPLPPLIRVGDTIPYEFTVTNTGGSTLTGVTVDDPLVGIVTCPATTLTPAASTVCTGAYVVTDADVTRGSVDNVATAEATGPDGPVVSPVSAATLPVGVQVALALDKVVDASRPYAVGESVAYTYLVTNTASSPVVGLTVEDDRIDAVTCDSPTLAPAGQPGDSTLCHASYVTTAADAQSGSVTNTAVATGNGGAVVSPSARATVLVAAPIPDPPPTPGPTASPRPPAVSVSAHQSRPGTPPRSWRSSARLARSGEDVLLLGAAGALTVTVGLGLARLAAARRRGPLL